MKTKLSDNERYYLHKKVKSEFKVNPRDKYITIPRDMAKTIQDHPLYEYIERLRTAGYHIQLSILKSKQNGQQSKRNTRAIPKQQNKNFKSSSGTGKELLSLFVSHS